MLARFILACALSVLTPSAPASPAEVQVRYYDVQGGDFRTLLAALNARGQHHGRADWKLAYTYRWRQGAGSCSVESLDTTLELVMTLPRWSPPPGAPADLRGRWDRYLAALRVHEEGHLDNGRSFEAALMPALAHMTAPDCAALDAALRAQFSRMLEDFRARDRDYDQRTGHGRTQGAEFR